jgi:hypothetical protein
MSASLTQNLGGFRTPDTYMHIPSSANADTSQLQSNNPYDSPSPVLGPSGGTHDQYPNYGPPSYEQATSVAPPPILGDFKREQECQETPHSGPSFAGPSSRPDAYQAAQPTAPTRNSPDFMYVMIYLWGNMLD